MLTSHFFSGMYSPVVFAIGQVLAETPWSLGKTVSFA